MNTLTHTSPSLIEVRLANGSTGRFLDVEGAVGVTDSGVTVAESDGFLYLLTDCCGASAKGSTVEDELGNSHPAVVCRSCYNEVDPSLGAIVAESDVIRLAA